MFLVRDVLCRSMRRRTVDVVSGCGVYAPVSSVGEGATRELRDLPAGPIGTGRDALPLVPGRRALRALRSSLH